MDKIINFPAALSPDVLPGHFSLCVENGDLLLKAEAFPQAIQLLARGFVSVHEASSRTAALFATQQRWLLSHVALSCYFDSCRNGGPGLTRRALGNLALQHGIASRNTAHAFFDEALKYGIIEREKGADRVRPSQQTLLLLARWYGVHFQALDLLDKGGRTAQFLASPERIIAVAQPIVTNALLFSPDVRVPGPLYTIFAWADAGGLLVDRLIAGVDLEAWPRRERYLTDVNAITHLAQSFGLSRAHASRKFASAESIGGMGWTGPRGRSRIWISRGFYEEYARAQACKLAILDAALSNTLA